MKFFISIIKNLTRKIRLRTWIALGIILILSPIIFFSLYRPAGSEAAWWNDNWMYRKKIPVTNNTTTETNKYIAFAGTDVLDTSASGKFQPDCGDIRFTTQNGEELPYYINSGCGTSSTDIDVFFETFPAGAQIIYMYYGNPTASNGFEGGGFSSQATNYTIGSVGSEETSPGPAAWWKMDEGVNNTCPGGSNDICDVSQNGNDGAFGASTAAPTWQEEGMCVAGKCLYFDGVDDTTTVSNTVTAKSVSLWVKILSTSTTEQILDLNGTDYLTSVNGTVTAAGFGTETIYVDGRVGTALTANNWHHVAVTTTSSLTANAIKLGQVASNYGNLYLDEIRLYSYERSATQVATDFNFYAEVLGKNLQESLSEGLVGYWKMDEVSGTTVADASGNNHTGTLINAYETGIGDLTGTSTTAVDADNSSLSSTNDVYNNMILNITGGTNSCTINFSSGVNGQERRIIDYDGSTKTITVMVNYGNASGGVAETDDCNFEILRQVAGKFGNGLLFDGEEDYVSVASPNLPTGDFTYSTWFKLTNNTDETLLMAADGSGNDELSLYINSNNKIVVYLNGSVVATSAASVNTAGTWATGKWYHLVVTRQGSVVTIYLNGVADASGISSDTLNFSACNLLLGVDADSSCTNSLGNYLAGELDEVRIYNRSLTASEVKSLYNWVPGPVGYWPLDTGTGTTAYDRSGHSSNGTLTNSPTWTTGKYGFAVNTNGTRKYINIPKPSDGSLDFGSTNDFTLMQWVRGSFASGSGNGYRFLHNRYGGGDPGYRIRVGSTNPNPYCGVADDYAGTAETGDFSTLLNDGKWHHVACVVSNYNTLLSIYIDGVLKNTRDISTESSHKNTYNLEVSANSPSLYWPGDIDEVKIYKYARTPAQIIEDMNAGHPIGGSPLGTQVLYWKFDEQNQTTAYDSASATSSNGTITNASWLTQSSCKVNGCLSFDASGDVVAVATANDAEVDFSAGEPFSGSAWVYVTTMPTSTGGDKDAIIAKWDTTSSLRAYRLYVENDDNDATGRFGIDIYDESADQTISAITANDTVSQNTWYHVAFTFNGGDTGAAGDLKIYVNGVYMAQNSANASFLGVEDVAADFTVGEYDVTDTNAADTAFTGYIDDVKIYSSYLTEDQIKVDYNIGSAVNYGAGQIEAAELKDGAGNSPILYLPFDENTGTTTSYDKSGNGLDATLNNFTQNHWAQGKYGSSIKCDGSASFAQVNDNDILDLTTAITVEMWVYPLSNFSSGSYKRLVDKDYTEAWSFITGNNNTNDVSVWIAGSARATTAANILIPDQWQHIGWTYDSNAGGTEEVKIYRNGLIVATGDYSVAMATNIDNLLICWQSSSYYFNGYVDDLKIYNYARTPAQMAYDYNRGGPIGHWKFDECQGNSAYDSSGNNNTGTIISGGNLGTCQGSTGDMWYDGATGKFNSALDFDGSSDWIDMNDVDIFDFGDTADFSITGWFYRDTFTTDDTIVAKRNGIANTDDGYIIYIDDATDQLIFEISDNADADEYQMASTSTFTSTGWHHFAVVWDQDSASGSKIYIDGKDDSATHTGTIANIGDSSNATDFRIGSESDNGNPFDGRIDDIRVYNYALSASQVKKIMNNSAATRFGPNTGQP